MPHSRQPEQPAAYPSAPVYASAPPPAYYAETSKDTQGEGMAVSPVPVAHNAAPPVVTAAPVAAPVPVVRSVVVVQESSIPVRCRHHHKKVERKPSILQLGCCLCLTFFLFPCCCLPFCCDPCYDKEVVCKNCNANLG
mmetsp:Transcript_16347/g.33163  ORF Transcript_16347/g.33163 Transcript_16347/m.33163 type:complete len:138 (+) Transcript_16347:125-538(+)